MPMTTPALFHGGMDRRPAVIEVICGRPQRVRNKERIASST
jgi:hypothetical protein